MVLGFVFVGAEMPEGAVGAAGVVEHFDVVEHGEAAWSRERNTCSAFIVRFP